MDLEGIKRKYVDLQGHHNGTVRKHMDAQGIKRTRKELQVYLRNSKAYRPVSTHSAYPCFFFFFAGVPLRLPPFFFADRSGKQSHLQYPASPIQACMREDLGSLNNRP